MTENRKRGRPFQQRDLSTLIGQQFGQLTIVGRDAECRGGHVLCLCECGNECRPLLNMVLSERTKSCGCLKATRFKEYWDRKAAGLPEGWRRTIFIRLARGKYASAVAHVLGMKEALVSAAGRLHATWLLNTYGETYRCNPRHEGLDDLSRAELAFLRKHAAPPSPGLIFSAEDVEG